MLEASLTFIFFRSSVLSISLVHKTQLRYRHKYPLFITKRRAGKHDLARTKIFKIDLPNQPKHFFHSWTYGKGFPLVIKIICQKVTAKPWLHQCILAIMCGLNTPLLTYHSRNSSMTLYFPLKVFTFEILHPLRNFYNELPYFLVLHINKT